MSSAPQWIPFPDDRVEVRGLPWFEQNAPDLWRLPKRAMSQVPDVVRKLARFPGGGRIRLHCTTSRLRIRLKAWVALPPRIHRLDAYVDDLET